MEEEVKLREFIRNDDYIKNLPNIRKDLLARLDAVENKLKASTNIFPHTIELLLGHLDILLETSKSFLIISATVFTTFIALDPTKLFNINPDAMLHFRSLSLLVVILSSLAMAFLLFKRKKLSDKILKSLGQLECNFYENNDIRTNIIERTSVEERVDELVTKYKDSRELNKRP